MWIMATYKPKTYDLVEAFRVIENQLTNSMMRNISKHIGDEKAENFNWSMWQAEQLNALHEYKLQSEKFFENYSGAVSNEIDMLITETYKNAQLQTENEILKAIKGGYKTTKSESNFFKINERKLNALMGATKSDFKDATKAMLRTTGDEYRKIIFNAQVYANTGTGTVRQAIDMATKDFLSKGINCIEYSNGARVPIDSYAEMALRTTNARATLLGEGTKRKEWKVTTVIVTPNASGCPKCLEWVGKVYIDDVWSGGKSKDGNYPLLSTAIEGGLYHPNCRDSHSTYFEGVNTKPKPMTAEEKAEASRVYALQQQQRYCERNVRKYKRLAEYSLDPDNKAKYEGLRDKWTGNLNELVKDNPELRLKPERVKTYGIDLNNLKWSDSPKKMLQKQITALDESMSVLKQKTYSNIWKDDVTVEDYASKKDKIQAKKDYFENKILIGEDVEKFSKLLADLDDFEKNGELFEKLSKQKDSLLPKPKVKKSKAGDYYTQERKDNALWFKDKYGGDKTFRPETGRVWKQLEQDEKYALYDYTSGSGKFNRPLSGFEGDWYNNKGVGKVDLNYEGGKKEIMKMTSALEKTSSEHDVWLQRGCTNPAMNSFFGIDNFGSLSNEELQKFVGETHQITSFVSCGSGKGSGFGGDVIMNIYCPKGTKMIYAEPFSHYNGRTGLYDSNGNYKYEWDGKSNESRIGSEFETIIQRGYTYRVTKIERSGYKIYIDLECRIEQGNYFVK